MRTVIAFALAVGVLGMAAGETPALVPQPRVASTCGNVLADDEELAIGAVMRLIVHCQNELALSEAQRARVEALNVRFIDETSGYEERREIAERQLAELMRPDPEDPARAVDLAAAEAKIREVGDIVSDEEISALRTVEATKAVLTSAQRSRLAALLEASRTRRLARIDL